MLSKKSKLNSFFLLSLSFLWLGLIFKQRIKKKKYEILEWWRHKPLNQTIKEAQGKNVYLCGREATQGIPLLGEPFDHRQGRSHVPQEGVGQKTVRCHLHLCWHHWEQMRIGCLLGFSILFWGNQTISDVCVVGQGDGMMQVELILRPQVGSNKSTWLGEAIAEAHESVLICHCAASQTPVGEPVYEDKDKETHCIKIQILFRNLSAATQPSPVPSLYVGNKTIVIKKECFLCVALNSVKSAKNMEPVSVERKRKETAKGKPTLR